MIGKGRGKGRRTTSTMIKCCWSAIPATGPERPCSLVIWQRFCPVTSTSCPCHRAKSTKMSSDVTDHVGLLYRIVCLSVFCRLSPHLLLIFPPSISPSQVSVWLLTPPVCWMFAIWQAVTHRTILRWCHVTSAYPFQQGYRLFFDLEDLWAGVWAERSAQVSAVLSYRIHEIDITAVPRRSLVLHLLLVGRAFHPFEEYNWARNTLRGGVMCSSANGLEATRLVNGSHGMSAPSRSRTPAPSRTRSPASHCHRECDAMDASAFENVKPSVPAPSRSRTPAPSRTWSPVSHRHRESDAVDASAFGNVKPSIPVPSRSPMPAPSRTRSPASHRHQESDATDASAFGNVKPSIPVPSQLPMPAPSRMQSHPIAFEKAKPRTLGNAKPSIPMPSRSPAPAPSRK